MWGLSAPPKLLAKAKSAENERRHEAEVRDYGKRAVSMLEFAQLYLIEVQMGECEGGWRATRSDTPLGNITFFILAGQ